MAPVWDALGLTGTLQQLVGAISQGKLKYVLVRGRSGTGKTTFCKALCEKLADFDFHPLTLRGDIGRSQQEYYPFFNLLRTRGPLAEAGGILSAAADDLPAGKNVAKRAIEIVGTYSKSRSASSAPHVHDAVGTEIVAMLRGRVRRKKTLLILDDVHAFDAETVRVLELVLSSPEEYLGKHASRIYVLASENIEEAERNEDPVKDRMLRSFRNVEIERCNPEQFPHLLTALGFTPGLQPPVVDDLYRRSGAHLRVLSELARQLASSSEGVDLYGKRDLLELVLTLRLTEPGAVDRGVRPLLARIAILGTSFTRVEVQCLLEDLSPPELGDAIRKSVELSLLESQGPVLSFQHSSIRDFFLRAAPKEHPRFHETFASCLRLLRPSDYAARIIHLHEAGYDREADTMRVLHWSRASRSGRNPELPLFQAVDYEEFVAELRVAHEAMQAGDDRGAIEVLEAMYDAQPDLILAERDLTLAECYLEDISYTSFERALEILSRWQGPLEGELELHTRLLFLLAMAHTLMAKYGEAEAVFATLMRTLAPVRQTDPGLQRMLNRVQLTSDCLHSIEISGRRIYSALRALLSAKEAGRAFNPLDLYVALTNYSGNQIISADYDAAAEYAFAATELRTEYHELRFPSAMAALNNHLLADLLGGRSSLDETLNAFAVLMEGVEQLHDHALMSVNFANVLCLTGRVVEAREVLETLREAMRTKGECDEYYVYYTEHALAAALLLSGSWREAKAMWTGMVPLIEKLPPGLREYLPHRHELLRFAFDDRAVTLPEHWNEYLHQTPAFRGRPWRFFRNGFLFSDLQFWFQL